MKPASFTYHRPASVAGAVRLLAELGEEAKALAGGQSLVPMMNFRLARPAHLVDLGRLPGLDHVRRDGDALRIGALVTHHAVETAALGPDFAVLSRAMRWIGHLPIRTRGTIGGSLAHGDPTAEWCLLAVLLQAVIVVHGPEGVREIPAEEFFLGVFETALAPDELIVEVLFPRPAPRAALTEFAERRGDFALVAAAVDLDVDRIVLGGVAAVPLALAPVGGEHGYGHTRHRLVADLVRDTPEASAHYRLALVRALVARATAEASA